MGKEEQKLEWKEGDIYFEVRIRNVGDLNKEYPIQITIDRYDTFKERSKPYLCLDIPGHLEKKFLKAVNRDKED